MSETPIADAVMDALTDALQKIPGKPIPTAFLAMVSTVDEQGETGILMLRPPDQPVVTSLGFVGYADEWFRDDVRFAINAIAEDE